MQARLCLRNYQLCHQIGLLSCHLGPEQLSELCMVCGVQWAQMHSVVKAVGRRDFTRSLCGAQCA